jgi:hypothetical protein
VAYVLLFVVAFVCLSFVNLVRPPKAEAAP